jgi:hypothetical protein
MLPPEALHLSWTAKARPIYITLTAMLMLLLREVPPVTLTRTLCEISTSILPNVHPPGQMNPQEARLPRLKRHSGLPPQHLMIPLYHTQRCFWKMVRVLVRKVARRQEAPLTCIQSLRLQ